MFLLKILTFREIFRCKFSKRKARLIKRHFGNMQITEQGVLMICFEIRNYFL